VALCLEHHLIPAFGPMLLDQIRHADLARWRVTVAETINAGTYSPHTANGWLDLLRVIVKAAVVQFELPRNPMDGIRNFDTSEHGYTEEEPNSLTVQEMPSCRRCGSSTHSTLRSSALASSWGTARRRCARCAARAPPRAFS
jgi:hypothetical protein